jgi:hypothetical protein
MSGASLVSSNAGIWSAMISVDSASRSNSLSKRDLIQKPVSTFRDHVLKGFLQNFAGTLLAFRDLQTKIATLWTRGCGNIPRSGHRLGIHKAKGMA